MRSGIRAHERSLLYFVIEPSSVLVQTRAGGAVPRGSASRKGKIFSAASTKALHYVTVPITSPSRVTIEARMTYIKELSTVGAAGLAVTDCVWTIDNEMSGSEVSNSPFGPDGEDYPANVVLVYEDGQGSERSWYHGFSMRWVRVWSH